MDNFNNGYPYPAANFQYNPYQGAYQLMPRFQQQQTQVYPQNTSVSQTQNIAGPGVIWVQGIAGAKSFNAIPGVVVPLFDSEDQIVYLKYLDQYGKPEMTALYYTDQPPENHKEVAVSQEYATKEQVDALGNQFSSINDKFNNLSQYVTKDQLNDLNNHLNTLSNQIQDIENRILSFGKPQQTNRKGNNNGKSSV